MAASEPRHSHRGWRRLGPTPAAVRAFGVRESALQRLAGGQGVAWTDGRLVLKPVGFEPEHAWVCRVYADWADHQTIRVPEPVPPAGADGRSGWAVDRWSAHVWLPGREVDLPREVALVKGASDAFHELVADLPRPGFLSARSDPWAFGDRLA